MQNMTRQQQTAYKILKGFCLRVLDNNADYYYPDSDVDWGYFTYFADINGLACLAHACITDDEFRSKVNVPFRVEVIIRNWQQRYQTRWEAYDEILQDFTTRADEEFKIVLLKGATLRNGVYGPYATSRGMGDIDLLVQQKHSDTILGWLEHWGYAQRKSKNGVTAIHGLNAQRKVIDVHIDDPSKSKRDPNRAVQVLLDSMVPSSHYDNLYSPSHEYSLVHCCKHFCEHLMDFRKSLFQDDIKIIRLLDIGLLLAHADLEKARQLAERLGWQDDYLFGLDLAKEWMDSGLNIDFSDSPNNDSRLAIETPLGSVSWPYTFERLAMQSDRAEWLSKQMGDKGARELWYNTEKGILAPEKASG